MSHVQVSPIEYMKLANARHALANAGRAYEDALRPDDDTSLGEAGGRLARAALTLVELTDAAPVELQPAGWSQREGTQA